MSDTFQTIKRSHITQGDIAGLLRDVRRLTDENDKLKEELPGLNQGWAIRKGE